MSWVRSAEASGGVELVARLSGSDWRLEPGNLVSPSGRARIASYQHLHPPGTLTAEARAAGLAVVFDAHDEVGTAVLAAAG